MSYKQALNMAQSLSVGNRVDLIREFDLLAAELADIHTKYTALLTKLDADAGVTDTNYAATVNFTAQKFIA
jgi:hypothetical protein